MRGAFLSTLGLGSHELLRDHSRTDLEEAELGAELIQTPAPLNEVGWSREGFISRGNIVTV